MMRAPSTGVSRPAGLGLLAVTLAAAAFLAGGRASRAAGASDAGAVKEVFSTALPNVPGKRLTAVLVSDPPGGRSGKHHHAGSVLAFVVSGAIRSENSATGPVRVYRAGEAFFEPPGSEHLVSENASVGAVLPLAASRQAHEMLEGRRPRPTGRIVLRVAEGA
jgi:quercetin dioxygenase-like cupin family protein